MGIIQAFAGAIGGTFADQWKDIITAGHFGEYTAVAPGVHQQSNRGRGVNFGGSADVISNGSKIFVPENTAAFIFSQAGIEDIITEPGGYEYRSGQNSIFSDGGAKESIIDQVIDRVGFGGQSSDQKQIVFVNRREIRGIRFGTRGPLVYNDRFYGADLEVTAFGTFSIRVVDPGRFIRNYVPPNIRYYAFDAPAARQQIVSEFVQSFTVALNSLSSTYRISQLPSQADAIARTISGGAANAGTWINRFGLQVVGVGIESIEFSPQSRELVKQYSANMMNLKAFEGISQQASNIAAQQKIAQGVQNHGFGDGPGMILGMNMAQSLSPRTVAPDSPKVTLSFDEQVEAVKRLKELVDAGILSTEEFETKKREIMGL